MKTDSHLIQKRSSSVIENSSLKDNYSGTKFEIFGGNIEFLGAYHLEEITYFHTGSIINEKIILDKIEKAY